MYPLPVLREVQHGALDLACLVRDAEAHGYTDEEIAARKRGLANAEKERSQFQSCVNQWESIDF
jgi:hypothetical protein